MTARFKVYTRWLHGPLMGVVTFLILAMLWPHADFKPEPAMIAHIDLSADGTKVLYERTVLADHTNDWSAEVFAPGQVGSICRGHGRATYRRDEPKIQHMSLAKFVGDDTCPERMPPDARLCARWKPLSPRIASVEACVDFE